MAYWTSQMFHPMADYSCLAYSHVPIEIQSSTSFPPSPYQYNQPFFAASPPPPNSPSLSSAQIEKISTSINIIRDLVLELQESNSRMLSSLSDVCSQLQKTQLDSMEWAETQSEEVTVDYETNSTAVVRITESDPNLLDEKLAALDSQPLVIAVGDTSSELEGLQVLPVTSISMDPKVEFDSCLLLCIRELDFSVVTFNSWMRFCFHLVRPRVANNLFDQMLDPAGLYRYSLTPEHVTTQDMLSHFPFDPGSYMFTTSSSNYFHVASSKSLVMKSAIKLFERKSLRSSIHKESSSVSHSYFALVPNESVDFHNSAAATLPGIYALSISGRKLWVPDFARLFATQFTHQVFDAMLARERTGIMTTVGFVSPPGDTYSNHVTFATLGIVQFLWALNKILTDYIVTCGIARGSKYCVIDGRSSWLVEIESSRILSTDFVGVLVKDPGNDPNSSINGGVLFLGPSPLSVAHLQEFQRLFMDTDIGGLYPNATIVAPKTALHAGLHVGYDQIKQLVSSNESNFPNDALYIPYQALEVKPSTVLFIHDQLNEFLWEVAFHYGLGVISEFHVASVGCLSTSCFLNQKELRLLGVPANVMNQLVLKQL